MFYSSNKDVVSPANLRLMEITHVKISKALQLQRCCRSNMDAVYPPETELAVRL
jgi:hypothetical protein